MIYIKCNDKNLTVETFIGIDNQILMSNAFFWLEIIIYEVLLTFTESLLVFRRLSTLMGCQSTMAWTLSMSLSDAETVLSSAKWTKRIWFEDLCMSLTYKRKSSGPSTEPCRTPNVMFDIEELEFLTEIFFLLLK